MEKSVNTMDGNTFLEFGSAQTVANLDDIDFGAYYDFDFMDSEAPQAVEEIFDVQTKLTDNMQLQHSTPDAKDSYNSSQENLIYTTLTSVPSENDHAMDSLMEFLNDSDDTQRREIQSMKEFLEKELSLPEPKASKEERYEDVYETYINDSDISRTLEDTNFAEAQTNSTGLLQNNGTSTGKSQELVLDILNNELDLSAHLAGNSLDDFNKTGEEFYRLFRDCI